MRRPWRFTRSKSAPFFMKKAELGREGLLIGNGESVPPFLPSPGEDLPTIFCAHPLPESMIPFSLQARRLAKCHRHGCFLLFFLNRLFEWGRINRGHP